MTIMTIISLIMVFIITYWPGARQAWAVVTISNIIIIIMDMIIIIIHMIIIQVDLIIIMIRHLCTGKAGVE